MRMRFSIGLALLLCSAAALAERQPGWDFGGELLYQFSQDVNFKGGSNASVDDDLGLALSFVYRFNSRFELLFGFDWNNVDYKANIAPAPISPGGPIVGNGFSVDGTLEYWTPRIGVNFNLLEGDLTPYVTGGIGWAFIDTNIPDGRPTSACYWDPWYGYVCGTFQDTKNFDELTYNVGVGLRWDVSRTMSLRFGYERHWLDLGEATSQPGFDVIKLGLAARY
ncbi:MAG TPA: outer membrane beta-barrel protein [Steroidobacteraceae bacterium]|jgi:opacity protein-like surface antigen|nr:outer membrane beta-barrel protein [Steroidobacteraceae bacterium]